MRASRVVAWVTGTAVFCLAALSILAHILIVADEAWLLQVAHRMLAGEVLYRDIFCGTTPLAFWMAAAAMKLFGVELAVVRLACVLCWMLSLLLARDAAARLTSSAVPGTLALAAALLTLPDGTALYQPLATLFLLAALCAVLRWGGGASTLWLAAAGAAAGLSFASKYTVGIYALAAVVVAVMAGKGGGWRDRLKGCMLAGSAFAAVAGAVLLPIYGSGGWPQFLDYALLNKGRYVGAAGVSYLEHFDPRRLPRIRSSLTLADFPFLYAAHWLPVLCAAGVAWWLLRRRRWDVPAAALAAFSAAALCTLYPRADVEHVQMAAPALLVGVAVAWMAVRDAATPRWRKLGSGLVGVAAAGACLLRLGGLAALALSPLAVRSEAPHFAAVLVPAAGVEAWREDSAIVRGASQRGGLFFSVPEASRHYLAHRIPNPTPFDYPLATAFGLHGEEAVIDALRHKRIRHVCLREVASPLAPVRLEQFVKANLSPQPSPSFCTLYNVRD